MTKKDIITIVKSAFDNSISSEAWSEGDGSLYSEVIGKEDFFEEIEQEISDLFDNEDIEMDD